MHELRCDNKLHGVINPDGNLEFKCRSNFCGATPGVVVIHVFSPSTGKVLKTKKYRDVTPRKE